jgi:hypothetical protein
MGCPVQALLGRDSTILAVARCRAVHTLKFIVARLPERFAAAQGQALYGAPSSVSPVVTKLFVRYLARDQSAACRSVDG